MSGGPLLRFTFPQGALRGMALSFSTVSLRTGSLHARNASTASSAVPRRSYNFPYTSPPTSVPPTSPPRILITGSLGQIGTGTRSLPFLEMIMLQNSLPCCATNMVPRMFSLVMFVVPVPLFEIKVLGSTATWRIFPTFTRYPALTICHSINFKLVVDENIDWLIHLSSILSAKGEQNMKLYLSS